MRMAAAADPRAFLAMHPPPVIFDEVQYAPDVLPYIKEKIDARHDLCGQYILTGSQNLLVVKQVTESLAGRAAMLRLLPLTHRETAGDPHAPLMWETDQHVQRTASCAYDTLWKFFLRGSFPELAANPDRDATLWHASYVQTYLERDVRSLRQVGDLTLFQNFLAGPCSAQRSAAAAFRTLP